MAGRDRRRQLDRVLRKLDRDLRRRRGGDAVGWEILVRRGDGVQRRAVIGGRCGRNRRRGRLRRRVLRDVLLLARAAAGQEQRRGERDGRQDSHGFFFLVIFLVTTVDVVSVFVSTD